MSRNTSVRLLFCFSFAFVLLLFSVSEVVKIYEICYLGDIENEVFCKFICIYQIFSVPLQRILKCAVMGTLLNTKEPKTDKGNPMYEFKRVHSDELQQYRIPVYGYLA